MNAAEFREKLAPLSDVELARRLYLIGLVQRIDAELIAMKTLFGSGDEALQLVPPPDARVTSLQHLMQVELKRRIVANSTHEALKGEENHANDEQNGTH